MCSIKFRCPNLRCRVVLSIPHKMRGRHVRCAGCGQEFVIPILSLSRGDRKGSFRKAS